MKDYTIKKIFLNGIVSFLFFCTVLMSSASAQEFTKPMVSYQANQKALLASDFFRRLSALPEWDAFYTTFTETCNKALENELSRERLLRYLPEEIVDDISKEWEKGIQSKQIIESFFEHTEALFFEFYVDGPRGCLALIGDVDPRNAKKVLTYFREGTDFEILKDDPNGDFLLKFDFKYHGIRVLFYCAGLKLKQDGLFGLFFSNGLNIWEYAESFRTGKNADRDYSQSLKELVLDETCFHFLERQRQQVGLDYPGSELLEKVKELSASFHDVDGISQFDLKITMRSKEDAETLRRLIDGLVALVQLSQTSQNASLEWLHAFSLNVNGEGVFLIVKLDNPELWKLISKGLDKATKTLHKGR